MKYNKKEKICYVACLILAICIGIVLANYKIHSKANEVITNPNRIAVEINYKDAKKGLVNFKGYLDKDNYRGYMTIYDNNYILSLYKKPTDMVRCNMIIAGEVVNIRFNFKEEN